MVSTNKLYPFLAKNHSDSGILFNIPPRLSCRWLVLREMESVQTEHFRSLLGYKAGMMGGLALLLGSLRLNETSKSSVVMDELLVWELRLGRISDNG